MIEIGQIVSRPTDATEKSVDLFARIISVATLLMIGLSWPLWVGLPDFPRVPTIPYDLEGPRLLVWTRMIGTGVALLGYLVSTRSHHAAGRSSLLGAAIILIIWSILADIERFQPWVYQFLLAALSLSLLPTPWSLRFCRWGIVAIYFYSGLSKLDYAFATELGPVFLGAIVEPVGLDPGRWTFLERNAAILAMPIGEIATPLILLQPRLRWLGLMGASAMHLGLIAILGPWNLGHSTILLVWNASLLAEVWVLFAPALAPTPLPNWRAWPAFSVLAASLLVPALEPFGLIDPWPGHALYASHAPRLRILVGNQIDTLPSSMRSAIIKLDNGSRDFDLTTWSRVRRGVPIYPANWSNLAIATWLAPVLAKTGELRVEVYSQATRIRGIRRRQELQGLDEIARASPDRAR